MLSHPFFSLHVCASRFTDSNSLQEGSNNDHGTGQNCTFANRDGTSTAALGNVRYALGLGALLLNLFDHVLVILLPLLRSLGEAAPFVAQATWVELAVVGHGAEGLGQLGSRSWGRVALHGGNGGHAGFRDATRDTSGKGAAAAAGAHAAKTSVGWQSKDGVGSSIGAATTAAVAAIAVAAAYTSWGESRNVDSSAATAASSRSRDGAFILILGSTADALLANFTAAISSVVALLAHVAKATGTQVIRAASVGQVVAFATTRRLEVGTPAIVNLTRGFHHGRRDGARQGNGLHAGAELVGDNDGAAGEQGKSNCRMHD